MTIAPVEKILLTVVHGTAGVADGNSIGHDGVDVVYSFRSDMSRIC